MPRPALAPAETGWLARGDAGLVLTLPARFDGLVAACPGLGLPTLARLTGARPAGRTLPLARKLTSTLGRCDVLLLAQDAGRWWPQPAGTQTLSGLAAAAAPFDLPFG